LSDPRLNSIFTFDNSSLGVTIDDFDDGDTIVCTFTNTLIPAKFLLIDEDSIDNDDEPFTNTLCYQYLNDGNFTSTPRCGGFPGVLTTTTAVNADKADHDMRDELRFFEANHGEIIELQTGHITDEGWFALQEIPASWDAAGPTDDGIQNFLQAGPGLGSGPVPEALLDKITDVRPIRYEGVLELIGKDICGIVHDSDVNVAYLQEPIGENQTGVDNANLQGNYKGLVAFNIFQVIPFGDDPAKGALSHKGDLTQANDPQEIAKVAIKILDATGICLYAELFDAPFIVDENTSQLRNGTIIDFDSGFNQDTTPSMPLSFP